MSFFYFTPFLLLWNNMTPTVYRMETNPHRKNDRAEARAPLANWNAPMATKIPAVIRVSMDLVLRKFIAGIGGLS
jgi:hypothetical protein